MQYYYILGAVSYGIFLVQTIASFFAGDIDIDVDFDGDIDGTGSDILSFKGFVHFLMGFSGWLMLSDRLGHGTTGLSLLWAALAGLSFVVILYLAYKLCTKLQHIPVQEEGADLIGKQGKVYLRTTGHQYIVNYQGNEYKAYLTEGSETPKKGDIVSFDKYQGGHYYITKC